MENIKKPVPLFSVGFARAYWVTLRPYLFFLSGAAGLVGLSLASTLDYSRFVPAMIAFFLTYGLGQALTDVFQVDTDSISSPYRPLTQGIVTKGQVFGVSLAGLAFCGAVFLWCNPWTIPLSVLGVIGLATYTPFKRRWWGGPFWNSWIVSLLPVMGYLCLEADPWKVIMSPTTHGAMVSLFFSYAIFVLLGYFKDISADRQTGYNTFPVVFGWKPAVLKSTLFAVGATLGSAYLIFAADLVKNSMNFAGVLAGFFWLGGVFFLFLAHYDMWIISEEKDSHGPIAHCIRGYVLLHLGEAMALKPELGFFCVLYYLAFEWVLAVRPEKSQI